ncbi:MAG: sensor histidine kinase [Saprospiraceae bacterium]|nr:sensor histidine kinase [Saprospiraceae bacterium]
MKTRYPLFVLFLLINVSGVFAQFDADSTYSYTDLNKILELARENKDQQVLGMVYYKMAEYESTIFSNNEKALEFFTRAQQYFKISADSTNYFKTNQAIAESYLKAGLPYEASSLLQNNLKHYTAKNDIRNQALTLHALSRFYRSTGETDKSLESLNKAIRLNEALKDSTLFSDIYFDKIRLQSELNEIDSALLNAYLVFKFHSEKKNYIGIAKSLYFIGTLNKKSENFDTAIKYLLRSQEFVSSVPFSEIRKDVYNELSECYAEINDYKKAYTFNLQYNQLNDSILNKNRIETYTNLAIKYGLKDKQSSIEVLKIENQYAEERNRAQRRILYILAVGLIFVLIAVYFIIRFYNQRIASDKIINTQREEINSRKIRELEDNIKISSMQSVIEGQEIERERIAKDLHDSLGGLLSTIKLKFDNAKSTFREAKDEREFHNAQILLDTAVEEVRTIARNLQPGSLKKLGLIPAIKDLINRFEGEQYPDIDFQHYEIPEKMDKMIALSVYRIIQELLTNTLKHAKAKEILIQLNKEDNELVIQYEDDGIGFDANNVRKGMGLENIISRTTYLHGTISIDTKQGEGMSVLIRIKNITDESEN